MNAPKAPNHSKTIKERTGLFFALTSLLHFIVLSFVGLKTHDIDLLDKTSPIRLDEIKFLKRDVKSHSPMNLNANKSHATGKAQQSPLNLKSLSFDPTHSISPTPMNPNQNQVISDQVKEQKAQRLNPSKGTEATYIEKSEARELLNRHRRRMRTPEIQMDQEAKLGKLNSQLGKVLPAQISDFNFSIVPNKKLSEESLNALEKKFYAFYLRLSDRYSSTISSHFQKAIITRPQLKNSLRNSHVLQAKIVYDQNGNLVLTKILKSSDSSDVHMTFEEIISDFSLPNVPAEILDDSSEFTVYFTLTIN